MNITSGKQTRAQRVVIYGVEGIGKTTLASQAPDPLYIDTEGGTAHLDVKRLPRPQSWKELLALAAEAACEPEAYGTLVIDTMDWAEQLLVEHVLKKYEKKGIEDFGYGKGYVYMAEEFAQLLKALDKVIAAGRHVIVTAHAMMRKQELPDEAGAFDRYELKLSKKIAPMVKEWSDALLFCNYKTLVVVTDSKTGKGRAQGAKRVIYTTHGACWDAKNRFGLADELPMEYASIAALFAPADADPGRVIPGIMPAPAKKPTTVTRVPVKTELPPADAETLATLRGWMEQALITEEHVRRLVAQKGHFPYETRIEQYPEKFVRGWLMRNWDKIVTTIQADPEYTPF